MTLTKNHLILGAGNLGLDIAQHVRERGDYAHVLSRRTGFNVIGDDLSRLPYDSYDVVWYCVGAGSVAEAKSYPVQARIIFEGVPARLMQMLPGKTRLILFSTDYCASKTHPLEPRMQNEKPESDYARIRCQAEQLIAAYDRPQTAVIRCGSLYGRHKPAQTVPGKVMANHFGKDGPVRLPMNECTPTSTRWLAGTVYDNMGELFNSAGATFHHCAPFGNVSIREWGTLILPERRLIDFDCEWFYDPERPATSRLECSFGPSPHHWREIWEWEFKQSDYFPRQKAIHELPPP